MDRRRALATVASLTIGATAIAGAVGATTRVFNVAEASPGVGRVSPVSTSTRPPVIEHRVVEVEDPAGPLPSPVPPAGANERTAPSTRATGSTAPPLVTAPAPPTTAPTVAVARPERETLGEDD